MRSLKSLSNMKGRCSLVTGGAGHLGAAIVETLAEAGSNVIILDVDEKKITSLVEELSSKYDVEFMALFVNLADIDQIRNVSKLIAERFSRLDVLINTAAMVGSSSLQGWTCPFQEQSIDVWNQAINVNLTNAVFLIQSCYVLLKESESASIINIGSIYGFMGQKTFLYKGLDYHTPAAYAASKGGLLQMTKYLATTLDANVRVNSVSPGGISRNQDSEFIRRYESATPLKRMATEEDFKGIILFLASDLSLYVTGQNVVVDGGFSV